MAGIIVPTGRRALLAGLAIAAGAASTGASAAAPPAGMTSGEAGGHRHVEWLRDFFEARWQFDNCDAEEDSPEYNRLLRAYGHFDDLINDTPAVTVEEAAARLAYIVDQCRLSEYPEEWLIGRLRNALTCLGVTTWRRS